MRLRDKSPGLLQSLTYQYQSLEDASSYIRLLRLLHGSSEPIECTLAVHELQRPRSNYVAISYVWGLPGCIKKIRVNGFDFRVPHNCWYALWQMRNGVLPEYEYFWIDYVCMNQADVEERNTQVRIMGKIFATAAYVAACIGETNRQRDFETILGLGPADNAALGEDHDTTEKTRLRATEALCSREYFRRLWIVQECRLAQSVRVYCGTYQLRGEDLLQRCSRQVSSLQDTLDTKHPESTIYPARRLSLTTLLPQFADRKCVDVRDKVYALLSLTDDWERKHMPIDYNREHFEILRDFISLLCDQVARDTSYPWDSRALIEVVDGVFCLGKHFMTDIRCSIAQIGWIRHRIGNWFHGVKSFGSFVTNPSKDNLVFQVSDIWELEAGDFAPLGLETEAMALVNTRKEERTVEVRSLPGKTSVGDILSLISHLRLPLAHAYIPQHEPTRLDRRAGEDNAVAVLRFHDDSAAAQAFAALDGAQYQGRELQASTTNLNPDSILGRCVILKCKSCGESAKWIVPEKVSAGDFMVQVGSEMALIFRPQSSHVPHNALIGWAEPVATDETKRLLPCHCCSQWKKKKKLVLHIGDLLATALVRRRFHAPGYFIDPKSYLLDDVVSSNASVG